MAHIISETISCACLMSDEWQKHTEAEDSLEGRLDTYSNSYKGIQMSRSMLILEQVKHISQVNVHA
jgi:hypothetical protein